MKYHYRNEVIPQSERQSLNDKIIYLIDSGKAGEYGITQEDIYNGYTGDGGLHGLNRADYDSYADYSKAKKEVENGQFFTPPDICRFIAECLKVNETELIADLTCGMGSLFNDMPVEKNLYGCEIDMKAYKVAKYLYPNANIENKDVRLYDPKLRFDYIIGNPPFHLRWWIEDGNEMLSHFYYCLKASDLLKPFGILAVIVPMSFLADDFTDSGIISKMAQHYSFLGQISLPSNSFSSMGVSDFPTKLQFWQKKGDLADWSPLPYSTEITHSLISDAQTEDLADKIHTNLLSTAQNALRSNRLQIILELAKNRDTSDSFQYQVKKYLYHIHSHPLLKADYMRCCEYLHRFYTQKQPSDMTYQEWSKVCLTEAKVLAYMKKVIQKQNQKPPRDEIIFVKRDYDFVYKGYSAKVRRQLSEQMKIPIPFYEAATSDGAENFPGYEKLVQRKQREYAVQNQQFADMQENADISEWLTSFRLWDSENEEEIKLNQIQRHDLNLILQKRYGLLQWEQGSGKTLAGISASLYRMQRQNIHHTWVVSTAISIKNNWDMVLKSYHLPYVMVEKLSDLDRICCGDFVLITLNKLSQYRKQIKRWVRINNRKINLIFDESDEMTNPYSIRTKAVLDCFRRCKTKLLTTGTSTRNNISEFAPQLELLYNNSFNMLSWCSRIYRYDRADKRKSVEEGLNIYSNPYYGRPIPAYRKGYSLFSASHLPEKITVFGVGQRTQDIYNADELNELLGKTVITRTFEEVSGKDIKRIHQVPVRFSDEERAVYQKAIDEFLTMRSNYFASTGNSRKDSMMRLIQQITLLLRIGAAPNTLKEYTGDQPVKISKTIDLLRQWSNETAAVGVRHKVVLEAYEEAIREAFPDRPVFVVTGSSTSFAKRRALKKTLQESRNGILLCTQQSLPSSVNFEFVNKIIIPEMHYNNARMSQFYFRFIRYTSTEWKDIYFITYAGSIESNLMQMVLAKEKINLFMKGQNADLDEIYERFGVDYDLLSLLMYREEDENGHFKIRWGEQAIQ